jgi:VCBS repeat-containing protein
MKLTSTLLTFAVVASSTLILTTSCKKSSSSSAGVSGTVANTGFNSSTAVALYSQSANAYDVTGFSIKSGDTSILEFFFYGPIQLNKAVNMSSTGGYASYYDTKNSFDWESGGGAQAVTFTVTSFDSTNHKIAGTVSGELYNAMGGSDSAALTNGKFNTSFTVTP